jgi:hypothetical protein
MCMTHWANETESSWFDSVEDIWSMPGEVERGSHRIECQERKVTEGPTPGGGKDGKPVY